MVFRWRMIEPRGCTFCNVVTSEMKYKNKKLNWIDASHIPTKKCDTKQVVGMYVQKALKDTEQKKCLIFRLGLILMKRNLHFFLYSNNKPWTKYDSRDFTECMDETKGRNVNVHGRRIKLFCCIAGTRNFLHKIKIDICFFVRNEMLKIIIIVRANTLRNYILVQCV